MKSLFRDDLRYNDTGNAIDTATKQACQEIIDSWTDLGYSPREIYYVMSQAINDLSLSKLLNLRSRARVMNEVMKDVGTGSEDCPQ